LELITFTPMNIMFTKPKQTGGLISRFLLALALVLGAQFGAKAQLTSAAPYCQPDHPYMYNGGSCYGSYYFALKHVTLGGIDQEVKCTNTNTTPGPYRYYNNGPTTTLSPGATYSIMIQSAASSSYQTSAAAWIDFNHNNAFDASEAISVTGQMAYGSTKVTKSFTVPCSAVAGKTRMRVSIDYCYTSTYAYTASGYCGTPYGYGETIDYDVTIATAGSPTANFFLPDSIFTLSPATFANANQVGYIKHEWSTSVGGLGSIVSTNTNLDFAFPSAGTYQVRVKSTNCTGSATVTKNVTVIDPTTPPSVRFLASRNYIPMESSDLVVDEIVDFKDFSLSGPTAYQWDITPPFVDKFWLIAKGSLTKKEMTILFTDTGKYEICMTASNLVGSTQLCKPDYVVIEYPQVANKYENTICSDNNSYGDSGVVYDPGGKDGNYNAAVYFCTFNINACDAESIDMWFGADNFQFYYYGYVNIYDGKDATGKLLGTIGDQNGNGVVSTPPTKHYTATSGYATIEFINRYSYYSGMGFELYWKSQRKNDGPLVANFDVLKTRNDSIYSCATGTEVYFKDNSSGNRDIYDRQWIFDYDPNIAYPPGFEDFPDNGNEKNPLYTYSADKTYTVRLVTGSCENYDTTYRSFHIGSTTMVPNVDFSADANIINVGENTWLRNKTVAWCSGSWTINPSTYTLLNGSKLTDGDIQVRFDVAGRYTVKYTADNDNGTASRTRTDFIRVIEYCAPTVGTSFASMSVNRVKINTLENKSGNTTSGYENFTNLPATDLYIGTSYDLEVERDQNINPADRIVWIDLNRDGEFDGSEIVASDFNSTSKLLAKNITIPDVSSVTPGLARMRVAISLSGGTVSPCGPLDAGEFEDYLVNLKLDDMPPAITLLGSDTVYVEVNTSYTDAGATANDNREGDITSKIVTNNQVDITQTGIYVVTYNVKDGSGVPALPRVRFVFVLADMTAPVLTVTGNTTVTHEAGTPYSDLGATATDNPGAKNIDNLIVTNNMVDVNKLGTYDVDYTVTDAYGNTTTGKRTVQVTDTKAPTVIAAGGDPMTIQVGANFVDPTYADDSFEGKIPVSVVSGLVNTSVFGQYKVTYTASDASGNKAANKTRTYIVTDMIAPVISSLSGTQYMIVDVNDLNFVEPAVTGSDNYFPTVNITRNAGGFDISKLGTYDITYTGTDGAGNVTTWVRTIKVVDRVKPVVISTPVNVARWSTFDPREGVSTWDNYYAPTDFKNGANNCRIDIINNNVDLAAPGIYQVIYQAVDGSGNVSDPTARIVFVTDVFTGLETIDAGKLNIYPSPSNGNFTVDIAMGVNPNTVITVTNIAGQTVKTFGANDVVAGKLSVDLSGAAAGMYFVTVTTDSQVAQGKVTITR
jgi:PKD repeat protein